MQDILNETQEDRDKELARYLGVAVADVNKCEIDEKFGPVVHGGGDFRAKSYDFLYEELGRKDPATVLRMLSRFNVMKRKQLIRGAERHMGDLRGKRVLDFGCGSGGHGVHFLQRGAKVDFLDVVGPVYNFTRWRVKVRKLGKDARFLVPKSRLLPRTYDAVLCVDVLEHVANPISELERLVKATRGGGFFLLQIGYHLNPRQGHFKQSIGRVRTKRCQKYISRMLEPLESKNLVKAQKRRCYYFRRR